MPRCNALPAFVLICDGRVRAAVATQANAHAAMTGAGRHGEENGVSKLNASPEKSVANVQADLLCACKFAGEEGEILHQLLLHSC